MPSIRALPAVLLAALAPHATGQIAPIIQERAVSTHALVSSGASSTDSAEAANFGPFVRSITSSVVGAAGAGADADASQDSTLTPSLITAVLSAGSDVRTGATFVTGESDSQSNFLFIFNLAAPAPIHLSASGQLAFVGRNPNGEPSDLSGLARLRLLDANTEEILAGFQLNGGAATDSFILDLTLPAGQYVILANAQSHAFSADLLGPPARSGSAESSVSFSLAIVPAPAAPALLAFATLAGGRRRRRSNR